MRGPCSAGVAALPAQALAGGRVEELQLGRIDSDRGMQVHLGPEFLAEPDRELDDRGVVAAGASRAGARV
jgi:hypothetical protein